MDTILFQPRCMKNITLSIVSTLGQPFWVVLTTASETLLDVYKIHT